MTPHTDEPKDEVWAWMTDSRPNGGGIGFVCSLIPQIGAVAPLVHRDLRLVLKMRPIAQAHAKRTGERVWLRRYVAAEEGDEA